MNELNEEAERFKNMLTGSDQDQFAATKLDDMSAELLFIQSQRDATKEMMSMNRLQLFMDNMTDFGDTLVDLDFPEAKQVMAYVWGSVRYLLKRTNPTEKAFDNILETYELLGVNLIKVSEYTSFFREVPAAQEYLVNIYKDVQHFHSLAYKLFFTFRTKLWQKLHKPIWKDLRTTFNYIAESLNLHASKIQEYGKPFRDPESYRPGAHERIDSGIDPNQGVNPDQVRRDMSYYHVALNKLRDDFEDKEEKRKREMKNNAITWIASSTKIEKLQKDFREMRICHGTGRWLFRTKKEVSEWLSEDGGNDGSLSQSAIWLHGNGGFGKTILTSLVIDELEARREKQPPLVPPNSKTYYFYCQEEDPEHKTYLEILKGILFQMVNQDDYIVPLCHEKMAQGGCTSLSDADTAKSLIETIVQYNPRQYIIIDGLDECEPTEVRQTAEFFTKLVETCDNANQEHGQLRLMFMSRDVAEIRKYMTDSDGIIPLKPTDNAGDIKNFVSKKLEGFSRSDSNAGMNLSRDDKASIESLICRRSDDSFLYAHLAIASLSQHITKGDLLKEIREEVLPEELGKMYETLLGKVEETIKRRPGGNRVWDKSKLLLGWLVCAKRPLKWHEMQAILSFDAQEARVDFDNRMLTDDVRKYLGSLVHVLDGDHIRLIHTSAREYIVSNRHIDDKKVQCQLTSLCLRYLSLPCFTKNYPSTQRREQAKTGWFSFQDYACSKWQSHIDTFIRECSVLFGDGVIWEEEQRDFEAALQLFIDTHSEEIKVSNDTNHETSDLEKFKDLEANFYDNLSTLWSHIHTHQQSKDEERNKVGIPQINKSLLENRAALEELKPDDQVLGERCIKDFYGSNLFKCRRTLCRYFYIGYDTEAARKSHENRHDRPFPCPVSCNSAPIGFSTNKDKDRHVRIYHPDLSEGPTVFEALSRRQVTGPTRFTCHICGKNFTRKINLSGHERSHYGDRPYQCSFCDKAFARMNDCRRHEKIHKKDK
ncbi:hypothetical protein NW755_011458 [Fusarium falciforme]|uniref:C2H2-type domain-containing protein n=1 Tax=Fusarium falciforme TaxID=195108 RepID=A0A9W8UUX1_9HYPO|nr:hypothetical protein NW755_011458 [Fusarium falciforme]KAJ4249596.1 hypothetical protein NW757_007621 [Fusarium falciforme]